MFVVSKLHLAEQLEVRPYKVQSLKQTGNRIRATIINGRGYTSEHEYEADDDGNVEECDIEERVG